MSTPERDLVHLSYSSLQDYQDCPRRFQLRYILEQPWPAVQSEPLLEHERYAELGRRFHRLVEQHLAGLPVATLTASIAEEELARWWRHYLNVPPADVLGLPLRRAELALSAPLSTPGGTYRLMARYDLLAIAPGERAFIVDWKTERRRPTRPQLAGRMQTRVYRYVLVEAGQTLNAGRPLEPENVSMVYWFAEFPAEPEVFSYDSAQHAAAAAALSTLLAEIATRTDDVFPLTADARHCRYCVYRSLCERGVEAEMSAVGEEENETETIEFDWTSIEEVAY
ncbi:MAG: PD-(D/E)XK nuclease family protein [Thermoflexales bacterium]|nr:PD-(D/E)XK nuclease family protein [Thermoflexales bacterium]